MKYKYDTTSYIMANEYSINLQGDCNVVIFINKNIFFSQLVSLEEELFVNNDVF